MVHDRGSPLLGYLPSLDGLRAVAIGLVLAQHFGPDPLMSRLGAGGLGVRLFFVLSGYLITGVLLGYRVAPLSTSHSALIFYWRRFLRLAPPLYVAIIAAAALGLANMRHDWWWAGLYLYNFLVVIRSGFGPAGHLWTLAVEEQFYLLWPAVVLLCSPRATRAALFGLILLGPAYRAALVLSGASNFPQVLLPGNIDGLALGGLMAVSQLTGQGRIWKALANPWVFWGAALAAALLTAAVGPTDWSRRVIYPCAVNLASASLIALAAGARGERKALGWLATPPLLHVGRISYGLYVYHYFVPLAAAAYAPQIAALPLGQRAAAYLAAALLLAELSWWTLERPLRRWRRRGPGAAEQPIPDPTRQLAREGTQT